MLLPVWNKRCTAIWQRESSVQAVWPDSKLVRVPWDSLTAPHWGCFDTSGMFVSVRGYSAGLHVSSGVHISLAVSTNGSAFEDTLSATPEARCMGLSSLLQWAFDITTMLASDSFPQLPSTQMISDLFVGLNLIFFYCY